LNKLLPFPDMSLETIALVIFVGVFFAAGILFARRVSHLRSIQDEEALEAKSSVQNQLHEQLLASAEELDDVQSESSQRNPIAEENNNP
jgi:hypothetical protein